MTKIDIFNKLLSLGISFDAKSSYIRIGYWKRMTNDLYNELENYLSEECIEDEDTGYLYCYYYK